MGKKFLLTFGFSLLLVGGFITFGQKHVAAFTYCGVMANPISPGTDTINGKCNTNGQYYTALNGVGDVTYPYTTSSATLKTNFINYLNAKASSNYYYQRAGVAFIKKGLDGGTGTWQARLNDPSVTLKMATFNSCGTSWPNTAWDTVSRSVVNDNNCKTATPALIIMVNGKTYYAIKTDCGNPMGNLTVLPVPTPAPATLDGVKIDDSKVGTYGGGTDAAFNGLAVSVAGVGSRTTNPFYFGSGSDTTKIPSGTLRNVTVAAPPAGWVVRGYSLCDSTLVTDCNSTTMGYGAKYFRAASSFSLNFRAGDSYHMRWIFGLLPATLDGVKIDDSKVGTYGGNSTNIVYSNLSVSVSGVGSRTSNPFYFGNGGDPTTIPVASSSGTVRSVSVASPPAGWSIVGYSLCDTNAVADCNSTTMMYGGKYFSATSASSFSLNFLPGYAYHVRWVFRMTVVLNCGSMSISPDPIDPYTVFSISVSASNTTLTPLPIGTITMQITPASGLGYNVTKTTATGSTPPFTATFPNLGPTGATGKYDVSWTYKAPLIPSITCGFPIDASANFTVANMPYLSIYGGDAAAGAVASTTSNVCYIDPQSGFYSWNNHTTNFSGAGAQYAVMALGQINDFASSLGTATPSKLSFANTGGVSNSNGLFGGKFGATTASCDYTSDITAAPITVDTTIAGRSVNINNDVVYVTGSDVYISGNIVYTYTGPWVSPTDIPSFKLVVTGGNIFIDKNVTQLDGLYVAEPDSAGNKGIIYTCSTGLGVPVNPVANSFYNDCNNKLTINGSFVAGQVRFLRTSGSVGQATTDTATSNHAAEVFNYTPEMWLPRKANTVSNNVDSITGLPPVL
jgi:hypothetical protein